MVKQLVLILLLLFGLKANAQQEIKDYSNSKKAANIHTAFAASMLIIYIADEGNDPNIKNILIFSTITAIILNLNANHQKKKAARNNASKKVER